MADDDSDDGTLTLLTDSDGDPILTVTTTDDGTTVMVEGAFATLTDGVLAFSNADQTVQVKIDSNLGIIVTVVDPNTGTSASTSVGWNHTPEGSRPDSGPPGTGNVGMPAVDGDGSMSDTGLRPKFWGSGDTKDVWEISDTGPVYKILGDDGGGPPDAADKTDDIRRVKIPGGGYVAVEPWDKVNPKYQPVYELFRKGDRVTGYGFNKNAMARFIIGMIVAVTRGMQNNGRG